MAVARRSKDDYCILPTETITKDELATYTKDKMCRFKPFVRIMYELSNLDYPLTDVSYRKFMMLPKEKQVNLIPQLHPQVIQGFKNQKRVMPKYFVLAMEFEQITALPYSVIFKEADAELLDALEEKFRDRLDETTYFEVQACYFNRYLLNAGYDESYGYDAEGKQKIWMVCGENYTLRELIEERRKKMENKVNTYRYKNIINNREKFDLNSDYYRKNKEVYINCLIEYFGLQYPSGFAEKIESELDLRPIISLKTEKGKKRVKPRISYNRDELLQELPKLYKGLIIEDGEKKEVNKPIRFTQFPVLLKEKDVQQKYDINEISLHTVIRNARYDGQLNYLKFNSIKTYFYLEEDIERFLEEKLYLYLAQ